MKYVVTHYPKGSKSQEERVKKTFPYSTDGKSQMREYTQQLESAGIIPIVKIK